jgi:PAS domain S-box-containing protein
VKKTSIKIRLVVLFSVFILMNSIFIFSYFPSRLEDQAIKSIVDRANGIAQMTGFSVSSALYDNDHMAVDRTLQMAKQNQDVTYIVVTDKIDSVFAAYNRVKAEIANYSRISENKSEDKVIRDQELYQTTFPIIHQGRSIGKIYLGLSLRELHAETNWSRTTFAFVGFVIFVIGVAAVYGISAIATTPLRDMVQTAEQIARGDLSRRAQVTSHDEVGQLARSFNQMVDKLDLARRETQYLNRSLEKRVGERTQELLQEVNERKQAEEKISEQAALLDITQDAIIVRDLDDTILYWSKGAENMYDWEADAVLGRKVSDVLYKIDSPQITEAYDILTKRGDWRGELQQFTRTQTEFQVESRWTLVRNYAGRPKSVLMVNTDITEKKSLEKQFLRSQRMEGLGTLAGGIAHDLNNVLAPILMAVQMFNKRLHDEQSKRILETLERSAKRGAGMVKQVLTFARGVEGERVILQPKHFINEMQNIVHETFPKTIRIQTDLPNDLWTISGDATQLHQVFLNLSVNARDAMPNGGTLTLSAANVHVDEHFASKYFRARIGPYVVLSVTDTGTGIPPAVIDKIFDPFFTTKELGVGTGLGLSTVHSIVKNHDGFLNVHSELGKGTEFSAYFPAHEVDEPVGPEDKQIRLPSGHGELILIVDDEAAVCEIAKGTLESYGYRALTAHDGSDAVALFTLHKEEISLILTDILMPVMDGPQTIKAIRDLNPQVKIIASSGLSPAFSLEESNVDGYLHKPYTAADLLNVMHKVLAEESLKQTA